MLCCLATVRAISCTPAHWSWVPYRFSLGAESIAAIDDVDLDNRMAPRLGRCRAVQAASNRCSTLPWRQAKRWLRDRSFSASFPVSGKAQSLSSPERFAVPGPDRLHWTDKRPAPPQAAGVE